RNSAVRVGTEPIDLGGIGKGLALRWAAECVAAARAAFLIEAGGDCYLAGDGPSGDRCHVGVDPPGDGAHPLADLTVRDAACVAPSVRLRSWLAGGRRVPRVVDPRTGAPGGAGLRAVTVVGPAPAMAEVWSKVPFLAGREGIAEAAGGRPALWVTDDG